MATPTRPAARHRPPPVSTDTRMGVEAAALVAFVLAVVLWADALFGRG